MRAGERGGPSPCCSAGTTIRSTSSITAFRARALAAFFFFFQEGLCQRDVRTVECSTETRFGDDRGRRARERAKERGARRSSEVSPVSARDSARACRFADKPHLEEGDKVLLPTSAFEQLARLQIERGASVRILARVR